MQMQYGCSPDLLTVLHSTQNVRGTLSSRLSPPPPEPQQIKLMHTHRNLTWTTTRGLFLILRTWIFVTAGEGVWDWRLFFFFFLLWIEDDIFRSCTARLSEWIIPSLVEVQILEGEVWRQKATPTPLVQHKCKHVAMKWSLEWQMEESILLNDLKSYSLKKGHIPPYKCFSVTLKQLQQKVDALLNDTEHNKGEKKANTSKQLSSSPSHKSIRHKLVLSL